MTTHSLERLRQALSSRYLREPLIILAAYIPYFFARSHAVSNAHEAFANAYQLMQVENSIGIFKELSLQSAALSYRLLVHIFNIIYFYGHWPVIFCCGVYLFIKNPRVYTITRNAFLISGVVALILYTLFPVAPPRLSADGIVDTLSMTVPISYDKSRLVNPYAALPSLHVGWDLLIALGVFFATRRLFGPRHRDAAAAEHAARHGGNRQPLLHRWHRRWHPRRRAFVLSMWLYRHWPGIQSRLLACLPHRNSPCSPAPIAATAPAPWSASRLSFAQ